MSLFKLPQSVPQIERERGIVPTFSHNRLGQIGNFDALAFGK